MTNGTDLGEVLVTAKASPMTQGDIADMNAPVPRAVATPKGNSFRKKVIDLSFTMPAKSFVEAPPNNAIKLTGLRVSATIVNEGSLGTNAHIRVFGMTYSHMAQLSTLNMEMPGLQSNVNLLTMEVGDDSSTARTRVLRAWITQAWQNFQDMPEVVFEVVCKTVYHEQLKPMDSTSFQGIVPVDTICRAICDKMDRPFYNWGVTATEFNPHYSGSGWDQLQQCTKNNGVIMTPVMATGRIEIWPRGGTRGGQIPLITSDTGLISYPSYNQGGLNVKTLFNPNLQFGGKVEIHSGFPNAPNIKKDQYVVQSIAYQLESEIPNGQWFCTFFARDPAYFSMQGGAFG